MLVMNMNMNYLFLKDFSFNAFKGVPFCSKPEKIRAVLPSFGVKDLEDAQCILVCYSHLSGREDTNRTIG